MSDSEKQIKRIQQKIQQLLEQYDDALKENFRLKKELEKNLKHTSQQQQTIETLKQQAEILKISSGNWNEQDKKDFEKRINQYIKEIDKCIALLSE
jgi:cell shape-determining protein MreC